MTLKQFDVTIQDKPGEIATVADALAKSSVNIKGVSTEKSDKNATLHIISEDADGARKALKVARIKFTERDVFVIPLEYKAGELAKVAKHLADEGVNIETLFVLGGGQAGPDEIVIGVDRQEKAKKVLSAA
jgi:hypothetical protein